MKLSQLPRLAVLLAMSSSVVDASGSGIGSRFCPECTGDAAARQAAAAFAPPIRCDWPNGDPEFPIPQDLQCTSSDRDVLLLNPLSGARFAYTLRFDPGANRHLVETRRLSVHEREAAEVALDVWRQLASAQFGGVAEDFIGQGHQGTLSDTAECPDGTALDHVLNPELREWMLDELRRQHLSILLEFGNQDVSITRNMGISASVGPVTLSVGWSASTASRPSDFLAGFRFDVSEVVPQYLYDRDIITYRINDARWVDNVFVMDAEFVPELSRAAGESVSRLTSGRATIDNACVMQKLREYRDEHPEVDFTVGGAGGALFDFPPPGPASEPLCTKRLCARVCIDANHCGCRFEFAVVMPCDH